MSPEQQATGPAQLIRVRQLRALRVAMVALLVIAVEIAVALGVGTYLIVQGGV